MQAFAQTMRDESLCSSTWAQDWQSLSLSLSLSQIGSRSSLDNSTKPALQPQDDIPISVLLYIAQQRVIIVAISEGENYILGQI